MTFFCQLFHERRRRERRFRTGVVGQLSDLITLNDDLLDLAFLQDLEKLAVRKVVASLVGWLKMEQHHHDQAMTTHRAMFFMVPFPFFWDLVSGMYQILLVSQFSMDARPEGRSTVIVEIGRAHPWLCTAAQSHQRPGLVEEGLVTVCRR